MKVRAGEVQNQIQTKIQTIEIKKLTHHYLFTITWKTCKSAK